MFVTILHGICWRLVQHLSHSTIHPVQEWTWLQRKVWLCGAVRVHIIVINNKPVRVLSEKTGWLFTHKSLRSCFQHYIRFRLLRRPLFVNIPFWVVWWAGAHHKSHRSWLLLIPRAQRYLTFRSGFPRAFWCSRSKHVRIPYAASRDQMWRGRTRRWSPHSRWRSCAGLPLLTK